MKIKSSHITNSSSISYIVYVPEKIDLNKLALSNGLNTNDMIKEILEKIPDSSYSCFFDDNDYAEKDEYDAFEKSIKIIDKLGFPVVFDESGPENLCRVFNIATKENVEKIIKIHNKLRR